MKRVILGIVIFILVIGFGPIHELGHTIVAKILGGEMIEVTWLSFSPIIDNQGVYYGGGVYVENISCAWKWFLFSLSGGLFQGLVYFAISFLFSSRKFLRSARIERKQACAIYWTGLIFGGLGFVATIYELLVANQVMHGI